MITFILLIIIVLSVIFFSIQNATPVAISFLFWRFEASLAIVIFMSVITGILISLIFFLWRKIKSKEKDNLLTKQNRTGL